jgi:hypothetical protein
MINKIPNRYNSKYFSWQKILVILEQKQINLFQSLALMYSISFAEYMTTWQGIVFK